MSKKMKVLTIGSLLLNVLLIGVIIGDMSHRLRRKDFFGRHAPELASKLPEDKAELFRETVERVHLDNKDVYKQIREAREKTMKILTAPEFDEAAYRVKVDKIYELKGFMKRRLADATVKLARQFDQEERKVLAHHLRRPSRPTRDSRAARHARQPHHEGP
jgi:uncharacterized membrane protein